MKRRVDTEVPEPVAPPPPVEKPRASNAAASAPRAKAASARRSSGAAVKAARIAAPPPVEAPPPPKRAAGARSKKRKSAYDLDAVLMPPPSAGGGVNALMGVSPFMPGRHALLGDSPFTAAACAAAAHFLASPFGINGAGGASAGGRLRRGRRGADSTASLVDFLDGDLSSPGALLQGHPGGLSMRHSMSPGLVGMLGLPAVPGGVGGATPPLLYNANAGPSPFGDLAGAGAGSPAARLRHAAASFGLPSIMRKRARFAGTPASADAAAAAPGGASDAAAARSAGTAAAVRAAQASLAAAQAGPTPSARLTASAMGAAFMASTGGVGHPSGSPSSPDMELARALFVSPPPMRTGGAGTGPRSATRSRAAAAAAAGDLGGLASPFAGAVASAAFWNVGAEQRAAAAAANAAAAAAANAATTAGPGVQRGNARVSSIFRREPATRAGAAAPKEVDALEVMRRVEFASADVFSKAEAVLARSPAGGARATPSARRGAAAYQHSAALVRALHGGARAPAVASFAGAFSPYSAADAGAFSPVGGAGDALLALSPSTFLRA